MATPVLFTLVETIYLKENQQAKEPEGTENEVKADLTGGTTSQPRLNARQLYYSSYSAFIARRLQIPRHSTLIARHRIDYPSIRIQSLHRAAQNRLSIYKNIEPSSRGIETIVYPQEHRAFIARHKLMRTAQARGTRRRHPSRGGNTKLPSRGGTTVPSTQSHHTA